MGERMYLKPSSEGSKDLGSSQRLLCEMPLCRIQSPFPIPAKFAQVRRPSTIRDSAHHKSRHTTHNNNMNQPSYNQPTIEADISVPPTTTTAASFDPFAPATPASAPRPPPPPEAFAYAPVVEYAPSTNDSSSQQLLEAKPISSNAPTWNEVMEQQQQQQHSPQAVSVQEPNTLETNPTNTRPTRPPLAASTAQEQYQLLALKTSSSTSSIVEWNRWCRGWTCLFFGSSWCSRLGICR